MKLGIKAFAMAFAAALCVAAVAETKSIPPDQVDGQKIFWGSASSFERPANVHYESIVRATPEYEEIVEKKVAQGSARYWILISQASDHAVRLIAAVGRESDYDLIAARNYLSSLDPPIESDDITDVVLAKLNN